MTKTKPAIPAILECLIDWYLNGVPQKQRHQIAAHALPYARAPESGGDCYLEHPHLGQISLSQFAKRTMNGLADIRQRAAS